MRNVPKFSANWHIDKNKIICEHIIKILIVAGGKDEKHIIIFCIDREYLHI
jgi:hypothetical protein